MSAGAVVCLGLLLILSVAATCCLFADEDREERQDDRPSPQEERTRARMDALRTSQRIGRAAWRASRALYDIGRDDRPERDGR